MSLLSNLLAFSSLNSSSQRQQRSASANTKFFFEDAGQKTTETKTRIVSKSLSKMGLMSNSNANSKVDPKYRCLHRIVHNLSMKVRKHYYALFVTLQTMKKNNVSLSKKKSQFQPQRISSAVNKVQQTFSIRYQKQYENSYKSQIFTIIKIYSQKAQLAKAVDKIFITNKYRMSGAKLFKYFNQLQTLQMKIDLFEGYLDPVVKKNNRRSLQQSVQKIKKCQKSQNQQKPAKRKQVSIFQIYDNMQKKVSNSPLKTQPQGQIQIQPLSQTPVHSEIPSLRQTQTNLSDLYLQSKISGNSQTYDTDLQISKLISQRPENRQTVSQFSQTKVYENRSLAGSQIASRARNVDSSVQRNNSRYSISGKNEIGQFSQTPYQSRLQSLQSSPNDYGTKTKSPFKVCKKVLNLKQSVELDSLESRNYQKIYKCYKISVNFNQKPFAVNPHYNFHYQSIPKVMHKLNPQQFCSHEVEDLADKSNIFRDFKGSKVSVIENLQISNVVAQPFARAETMISDYEKNRQRYDNGSQRSQISYVPYMPHDGSVSSINHRQQSNFGCDAVNFKNSLVLQRQSMKKSQRERVQMFVKKKTSVNPSQMGHQSQQLQNLKNRKKPKNQYSQRKLPQQMISHNYERNYVLDNDYLIKRDTSPYDVRPLTSYSMQPSYSHSNNASQNLSNAVPGSSTNSNQIAPNMFNWQTKKSHESYSNSEGKNKSFSFNPNSDIIPRRLKFNGNGASEFDKRSGDDNFFVSSYSGSSNNSFSHSINSTLRDPTLWKNQFVENRGQMPVRDVGMEPISKLRMKTNTSMMQTQNQINKDLAQHAKKYINISKR